MFPIHDDNPTLGRSAVTLAIIGLNVASWVIVQGLGSEPALARSVCELGAVPGELLGTLRPGTSIPLGPGIACVIEGHASWLTVLTSMFLHGGWLHLIGNMWFLWVFGNNVEDVMNPLHFALFYLLCGFAAVAAQMVANPLSPYPMVGASGAIGGVMGAYARLYPRARVHLVVILVFYITRIVVPAWLMLGYWLLLQLLGGLPALGSAGAGVAFWAHVGGFMTGMLLVRAFADPRRLAAHRALVRWS